MNVDEVTQGNEKEAPSLSAMLQSYQAAPGAWSSAELLRLLIVPVLVTVLFVSGVYWIRLQSQVGTVTSRQASIMQVHLLPGPDPAPIAVAPASRPSTENVASHADISLKEPDPTTVDDPVFAPTARDFSPAEAPPSNIRSAPSLVSEPANSAAVKFQQTLLRHVARYQRYPATARALHLEGKVDTQFSMSRDGTLLGVWVRTSSGRTLLDKEAIETIRRAQPLPSIPPGLPDRLNIHLQLEFDPS